MKSTLSFIFTFLIYGAFAQNLSIDIVTYNNEKNTSPQLTALVNNFISAQGEGCVTFQSVDNINSGSAELILELWDSEGHSSESIFKEKRTKTVTDAAGNKSSSSYTASGVQARTVYEIYGRLYERADGNILETFKIGGTYDHEKSNSDIESNYPKNSAQFKEVNTKFLEQYSEDVQTLRAAVQTEIDSSLSKTVYAVVGNYLPPAKITGIAKVKKDKVKKANFEKCDGVKITGGGLFKYPIRQAGTIGDETVYRKVGSCYMDMKPGVVGIGAGEKELLPLIKANEELSIGAPEKMEPSGLSKYKEEKTKNLSFVFIYQLNHNYNEMEMKHLELMCEASFVGYADVKVIANDPVAIEMNKTFAKSIYDMSKKESTEKSLLDDLQLGDMKSNSTIYVEIGNAKKSPLAGKKSFLGQKIDADPNAEFFFIKFKYKDGDKTYEDMVQMSGIPGKNGLTFNSFSVDAPKVRAAILNTKIQIIGIEEEKKDKVKKVIVTGHIPFDGGTKYKVYDRPGYSKKTKPLAVLSIDDNLNTYVATAKVKEGDKIIKGLMEGSKELYIDISKSGGLFSGTAINKEAYKRMYYTRPVGDRL